MTTGRPESGDPGEDSSVEPVRLRRLGTDDASEYRALMLEGYARFPRAFTSTVEERSSLPLGWWRARLEGGPDALQRVVGAFAGRTLVGVAGLRLHDRPRTRHKAWLYGMYVRPEAGASGVGRSLVGRIVGTAEALPDLSVLQLTVAEDNERARRLYESCGFRQFGLEPYANLLEGEVVALVHMWRSVDPAVSDP